jgi:hypothetical protein
MSHFTNIKTQNKDIEALQAACQELGIPLLHNSETRGSSNILKCDVGGSLYQENGELGFGLPTTTTGSVQPPMREAIHLDAVRLGFIEAAAPQRTPTKTIAIGTSRVVTIRPMLDAENTQLRP